MTQQTTNDPALHVLDDVTALLSTSDAGRDPAGALLERLDQAEIHGARRAALTLLQNGRSSRNSELLRTLDVLDEALDRLDDA